MAKEDNSLSLPDVYKKEHRRRRRIIFCVIALAVYGIFLGGTWLVVRSPLFRIQNIEVNGNKSVSKDDILALINRRMSDDSFWKRALGAENILAWPKNLSSDDLRIISELKGLSIKKDYEKRSIGITVEERQPFGVWCFVKQQIDANNESSCWWFDDEGVLFIRALQVEGNLITVVDDYSQKNLGLGSNILPSEFIPNVFSVFKVISGSDFSIKEIRLNDINLQEVEVDTYAGPKLYFSLRFSADNALAVIQSLKNQPGLEKLQYIDFRLENRAYYK